VPEAVRAIDLNCDAGEGCGPEAELVAWVTSVNVACGLHAGDPVTARRTVELAAAAGVAVGAHPGFPDREGFGRRALALAPREVADLVAYQVGALWGICRAAGVRLCHVKPHGALYHLAARDDGVAEAVVGAVRAVDPSLLVVAPPGSALVAAAARAGLRAVREGFADRAYAPDGSLLPRHEPGAVIASPGQAAEQACRLARSGAVDTLCVHGDHPHAAAVARAVRTALEAAGFAVRAPGGA